MTGNNEVNRPLNENIIEKLEEIKNITFDLTHSINDLEERADELYWFADDLISESEGLLYDLGEETYELLKIPTDLTRETDEINEQRLDHFLEQLSKSRDLLAEAMRLISHELELKND